MDSARLAFLGAMLLGLGVAISCNGEVVVDGLAPGAGGNAGSGGGSSSSTTQTYGWTTADTGVTTWSSTATRTVTITTTTTTTTTSIGPTGYYAIYYPKSGLADGQLIVGNDGFSCANPAQSYQPCVAGVSYWHATIPFSAHPLAPGASFPVPSSAYFSETGPAYSPNMCPAAGGTFSGVITFLSMSGTTLQFELSKSDVSGVVGGTDGTYNATICSF